jgi:hypothetical protein
LLRWVGGLYDRPWLCAWPFGRAVLACCVFGFCSCMAAARSGARRYIQLRRVQLVYRSRGDCVPQHSDPSWSKQRAEPRDQSVYSPDFTTPANKFYQTEGYGTLTGLPVGSAFISGDLYIAPGANVSSATFYQSIGLWGVIGLAPTVTPQMYPISQFYNGPNPNPDQSSTATSGVGSQFVGEIRGYDVGLTPPNNGQWATLTGPNADPTFAVNPSTVINYGAWNTLRINYIAGNSVGGGSIQYLLNGTVLTTISGGPFGGIDPTTASIYEIILNSRTDGQNAYDVYWSNIMASLREEYYAAPALAPEAIVAGDALLGTYVDRRGLDWDGKRLRGCTR